MPIPTGANCLFKNDSMSKIIQTLSVIVTLLTASLQQQAQTLNVSVTNLGNNRIQISGMATAPGFSSATGNNTWGTMSLTWRIPKSAATPPLSVSPPPAATAEVTNESTAFTGAAPRNAFDPYGTDLTIFDLTAFGEPDDGYWYFQVNGTTQAVQDIPTGNTVVLYDFKLPGTYNCAGCVELLTTDIPALLNYGISTTSNVYNAGMGIDGTDVLNVVVNNAPLPVEWMYIKALPRDNRVIEVAWATAMEQNNAGFEVERSNDGGRTYHRIATVPGKGNSSTPVYYSITDEAVSANTRYYYRIKQTDLDGRSQYSAITSAALVGGNHFSVQVKPNPVYDVLTLELLSDKKQRVQLVISDVAGRLYKIERAIEVSGTAIRHRIPVSAWPAGTYVAKAITEDGTVQAVKFVISR